MSTLPRYKTSKYVYLKQDLRFEFSNYLIITLLYKKKLTQIYKKININNNYL